MEDHWQAMARVTPRWGGVPAHRAWLRSRADELFGFFERASVDPRGGFFVLDAKGHPLRGGPCELHTTTRLVHSFALGALMGRPGAETIVDHGLRHLWEGHRDPVHGGYFWATGGVGGDRRKQAYGHAFVLLAAASAKVAGHPDADRLLADVSGVIEDRFWDEAAGAVREEFEADWTPFSDYRGQNSNMHLTEALMAAYEATGEADYLGMAERIAAAIIGTHARAAAWRVPEHFTSAWEVDHGYGGDPTFRPFGTTPGHSLEWARLLVQLWELLGRGPDWMPDAASGLFARAVAEGWHARGAFVYTLDAEGRPHVADRYWWPVCEGIGAAAALGAIDADPGYEAWYRRIWDIAARLFIDHVEGGWHPQVGADDRPAARPFAGKPDIYHALQACLLPLLPPSVGLAVGLKQGADRP